MLLTNKQHRYNLAEEERGLYHPRAQYNRESMRMAHRSQKHTNCRSTPVQLLQLLQHPACPVLLFRIKGTLQHLLSVSITRTCHVHNKQKWAWTILFELFLQAYLYRNILFLPNIFFRLISIHINQKLVKYFLAYVQHKTIWAYVQFEIFFFNKFIKINL